MKFPVFSLLAGNLAFSETSSQLTPPSSGESGAHSTPRLRRPASCEPRVRTADSHFGLRTNVGDQRFDSAASVSCFIPQPTQQSTSPALYHDHCSWLLQRFLRQPKGTQTNGLRWKPSSCVLTAYLPFVVVTPPRAPMVKKARTELTEKLTEMCDRGRVV
jgi:hypothetical protein